MKNIFFTVLTCGLLTLSAGLNANPANPTSRVESLFSGPIRPKAATGNWVADVTINLWFLTIKTVMCDRTHENLCVQKSTNSGGGTTQINARKSDGSWINVCEGKLMGESYSDRGDHDRYIFQTEGYSEK